MTNPQVAFDANRKFATYSSEQCGFAIRDIHKTLAELGADADYNYQVKLYLELDAARARQLKLINDARPTTAELIDTIKEQHNALDILLAMFVEIDKTFMPSQSRAWPAIVRGSEILKRLPS